MLFESCDSCEEHCYKKKQCKWKSLINDEVAGLAFISMELLEHCGTAKVENLTESFSVVWDFKSTWWLEIGRVGRGEGLSLK